MQKKLAIGVSAFLALTAIYLSGRLLRPREVEPSNAVSAPRPRSATSVPALPPRPAPATPLAPVASPSPAADPADLGVTGYPVDLDALRQKLPDNLYWKLGVPTHDPEVAKKRAEEAKHWNDVYGRVLSGTASEEEIRQYYDSRRKLSEDYMKFAQQVLNDYGGQLPDRDRGLYELSVQMHKTRLDEIPRQIDEALARKREQDQRRDAWVNGGRP